MNSEPRSKFAGAQDGKKTGDRSGVGFFIPLSPDLGKRFPDLGENDKSAAHVTFLHVGSVPKNREDEFIRIAQNVVSDLQGPVQGHTYGPDYFVHPAKDRRVAVMRVRFSHDLAGLRWKLRDALVTAGFSVDDSFPLVYQPHVTLEYMEGLTSEYQGTVPKGSWNFDVLEIWGLPKVHQVKFNTAAGRTASRYVDAMRNEVSIALMKFLSQVARDNGVSEHVYVVGGAVRNFVIKEPIKDIDVVIDSVALGYFSNSEWFAERVREAIPTSTSLVTNNYGVAILSVTGDWLVGGENLKGEVIEIANARKESYGAGGYKPTDVVPATIKEDVVRREFTFNCMTGETLIPTEKGILRIDQIAACENGDQQSIHLMVAGQDGPAVAVGWQYSGFAPTLRVTTEWGHSFSCTHHHPVLVLRGHNHEWVQVNQLEEGDLLCVPVRQVTRKILLPLDLPDPVKPRTGKLRDDVTKPTLMTPELAFVIGCIIAEGSNTRNRVSFSNSDPVFITRYVECFNAVFGFQPSRNKVVEKGTVRTLNGVDFVANEDGYDIYVDSKAVVGWLEDLGLYCGGGQNGKSASHHKVIPWSILQADEQSQWAFLAAYLEGDGSIHPDTGRITFCSVSRHILQQLQILLGAHGILSKVHDRFVYINAVDSALLWEKIQPWMVAKSFDYTQRGYKSRNHYGIPKEYLQGVLQGRRVRLGNNQGPSVFRTDEGGEVAQGGVLEALRLPQRILYDAQVRGDFDGFLASLKAISFSEHAKLQRLFDLGYQYVEVTSVEDAGKQDVFDISMGDGVEPAFVANGVAVHNTLLWRLHDLADGPDKAEILDLTGCGLKDLQEGIMKCPSTPDKTFSDDPSRMIRALKFLIKYGFKIDPEVEASIKRNRDKLKNIPPGHLSNMIITLFYEGGVGKRALLEMDKLGLLDVIKEIAQDNKSFREALANEADEANLEFLFVLMDMGLPTGKKLTFLNAAQQQRVREVTVDLSHETADAYVDALRQPGKVLDNGTLIREFGLKGREIQKVTDLARQVLLDEPSLAASPAGLTEAVRVQLRGGRQASLKVVEKTGSGSNIRQVPTSKLHLGTDLAAFFSRHKKLFEENPHLWVKGGAARTTFLSWAKKELFGIISEPKSFRDLDVVVIDRDNRRQLEQDFGGDVPAEDMDFSVSLSRYFSSRDVGVNEVALRPEVLLYTNKAYRDVKRLTINPSVFEDLTPRVALRALLFSVEEGFALQPALQSVLKQSSDFDLLLHLFKAYEKNLAEDFYAALVAMGVTRQFPGGVDEALLILLTHVDWTLRGNQKQIVLEARQNMQDQKRDEYADTPTGRQAGIFEGPPAMEKAITDWMLSVFAGHVLATTEELLATYRGGRKQLEKLIQDYKTKIQSIPPQITEEFRLYLPAYGKDVKGGVIGVKQISSDYFQTGQGTKNLVFKGELVNSRGASIWMAKVANRHLQNLETVLYYMAPSIPNATFVEVNLVRNECLKYTDRAKKYASKTSIEIPVDLTGWKYRDTSSPLIQEQNKKIEEANQEILSSIKDGVLELKRAQKMYDRVLKGEVISAKEWVKFDGKAVAWWSNAVQSHIEDKVRPFEVSVRMPVGMHSAIRHMSEDNRYMSADEARKYLKPLIDPHDVETIIKPWLSSVKATILFQNHEKRGGQWDGHELQVDTGASLRVTTLKDLRKKFFWIRETVRHEVQHVGQSILQILSGQREVGVPAEKFQSPGKNRSMRQVPHELRPSEFYTDLADAVGVFVDSLKGSDSKDWRKMLQAFVGAIPVPETNRLVNLALGLSGGSINTHFKVWKENSPELWRKAVKEFVSELGKRGIRIPSMARVARIKRATWGGVHPEQRGWKNMRKRVAKTFTLNEGDSILFGKFLNKPGTVKGFGSNDKGDPTVKIAPPEGKGTAEKEVKLFKIREDGSAKKVAARYLFNKEGQNET